MPRMQRPLPPVSSITLQFVKSAARPSGSVNAKVSKLRTCPEGAALTPHRKHKKTRRRSLSGGCCSNSSKFRPERLTSAEIQVETRKAYMASAATMVTMPAMMTVPMTMAGAAAMARGAVAIDRMPMAVITGHAAFTIHRSATRTAVMGIAAAGMM
jgi:hypothetical protein